METRSDGEGKEAGEGTNGVRMFKAGGIVQAVALWLEHRG